jgi:hypothetical protein
MLKLIIMSGNKIEIISITRPFKSRNGEAGSGVFLIKVGNFNLGFLIGGKDI